MVLFRAVCRENEVTGVKRYSKVGPLHSLPGIGLKRSGGIPPQAGQKGFGDAGFCFIADKSVRQSFISCRPARIRSRRRARETAQLLLMKP